MTTLQHTLRQWALFAGTAVVLAGALMAQGVTVERDARVFYGQAGTTTQPATVDYEKVKEATPEWRTIRKEGVRPGSARYQLLMSDLQKRLKKICRKVAKDKGRDFVVDEDGLADAKQLPVEDLTAAVVNEL